jgi:transcriptional regulator with XRE-family HTH domain
LGLSYQAVRKVVRGDSGAFNTVNHLAVARLLEVSPDWLATGKSAVSETLRVNDTLMRSEPINTHAAAPALPRSINQVLADNLRAQMTRKGMVQQTLSRASGVAQTTISLYLNPDNRKPSASDKEPSAKLSEIQRLAAALRCSVLDLLQDNETLTREPEPIAPQSRAFASHHPLDDPLTVASIIADRYADDKQRLIAFKLINETREWMRQIEATKRADAELNSKVKNTDQ